MDEQFSFIQIYTATAHVYVFLLEITFIVITYL